MEICSGRDRMSATSAMKCTPQKTMCFGFEACEARRESLSESPVHVGVGIHVGTLVVVAEQDHVLAKLGFGGADAFAGVVVGEAVEAVEGDGGGLHDGPQLWFQGRPAWRQPPVRLRWPLASLLPSKPSRML
jgi:hypothetical protein